MFSPFVLSLLSFWVIVSCDPKLAQLSERNSCIKEIIENFISKDKCHEIPENEQTLIALRLSNCLLTKMGKDPISCQRSDLSEAEAMQKCGMSSEQWNTFSTFFMHIHNLCHFYWEVMHHQRTARQLDSLVNSANETRKIITDTKKQSRQLFEMQYEMKEAMLNSLIHQSEMFGILNSSHFKVTALTSELQDFIGNLNKDLERHYSSLHKILSTVDHAVSNLEYLQMFMLGEISTVNGMLYFIILFLAICGASILTNNNVAKWKSLCLLSIQVGMEITCDGWIDLMVGRKVKRIVFLMVYIWLFMNNRKPKETMEKVVESISYRKYKIRQLQNHEQEVKRLCEIEEQLKSTRIKRLMLQSMSEQQKKKIR